MARNEEEKQQLTIQGRATAAAGAAFVAAAIVNPLDVIKTRIQAQAMASNLGQQPVAGCSPPKFKCTSTLYEHAAHRALHHCPTEQQLQLQRYRTLLRHSHTMTPEAAVWLHSGMRSTAAAIGAAAQAAAASAADSAAAASAGAVAAFRRWGITEGPILIRKTPAQPPGWSNPMPVGAGASAAAGVRAGTVNACECAAADLLPSHSMWETAKSISSREGLPVLWRGTSASLLIAVPMVGIYMPLYDALLAEWSSSLGAAAPIAAGTAARTAAVFCVAPFELLRTRLQASAGSGVSIKSTITNFLHDHHHHQQQQQQHQSQPQQQQHWRQGALGGQQLRQQPALLQQPRQVGPAMVLRAVPRMWTGFSATLVRDVPFSALYWALVEPLRHAMLPVNSHWSPWPQRQRQQQQQQQQSVSSSSSSSSRKSSTVPGSQQAVHHTQLEILVANMVSGFIAGGVAAGVTTPFDVVKTRMQIAKPGHSSSSSSSSGGGGGGGRGMVWDILKDVYRREGVEGLFSGLKPRAYRAAPACAIVISVYELLKDWLTPHDDGALA